MHMAILCYSCRTLLCSTATVSEKERCSSSCRNVLCSFPGTHSCSTLGVHQGPTMCCQGHSSQLLMGSSCCQHCQAPPKCHS